MDTNRTFIFMLIVGAIFIGIVFFTSKGNNSENSKKEVINKNEVNNKIDNNNSVKLANFELLEKKQEKEDSLVFENKNIKIEFSKNDAIIKNAWIKNTFLNQTKMSSEDLVQGNDSLGALQLKFGAWENEITLFQLTGGKNTFDFQRDGNKFIFSAQIKNKNDGNIYTIKKIYSFIEEEMVFKLDIEISNEKNIPINFDNSGIAFSVAWGPLLGINSKINTVNDKPQYNTLGYLKVDNLEKVNQDTSFVKDNKYCGYKSKDGNDGWVTNSEHYYTTIFCSDNQNYKYLFDFRDRNNKNYYCGYARDTRNLSSIKSTFYIYIGPKINSELKKYDNFTKGEFDLKDHKFTKVEEQIFWGIGNAFIGLIGYSLNFINTFAKNYGLAIVILTLIIKLLTAPLTHKSMMSQNKMTKIQPKIKELQEKYKDKPDILNKETMNLYKKEGINPFGGCLPLLLQMPILMAMYSLLDTMIQLKGADFLWIKDLSLPDSVLQFPFVIPLVNISSLNIMPIIMTGVSVVSTMLMPDVQSNKQTKMMMWIMPIMFFFLFYNVSSGLVLYWTVMNILNLGQQVYINTFSKIVKKKIA